VKKYIGVTLDYEPPLGPDGKPVESYAALQNPPDVVWQILPDRIVSIYGGVIEQRVDSKSEFYKPRRFFIPEFSVYMARALASSVEMRARGLSPADFIGYAWLRYVAMDIGDTADKVVINAGFVVRSDAEIAEINHKIEIAAQKSGAKPAYIVSSGEIASNAREEVKKDALEAIKELAELEAKSVVEKAEKEKAAAEKTEKPKSDDSSLKNSAAALLLFVLFSLCWQFNSYAAAPATAPASIPAPQSASEFIEVHSYQTNYVIPTTKITKIVSGKNTDFLLLDAGYRQNFRPGMNCQVLRNEKPLATLVIADATEDRAVALLTTDLPANVNLAAGDAVRLKLQTVLQ
jgi:hypothetical protein